MIIGLVGFIGSGKGSVAKILEEKYGFVHESFAKSVKDAVSVIFNWDRALLEGDTEESRAWREEEDKFWSDKLKWFVTPRRVLQFMGTEAGRNTFGEDLWTTSVLSRMNMAKNYVISDVRFPNELKMIVENGGTNIEVRRNELPWWYWELRYQATINEDFAIAKEYMNKIAPDVHYSEWAWVGNKNIRCLLNNLNSLEELKTSVDYLMSEVLNENK